MAFNSIEYGILFLIAFSGTWLLRNRPKSRILFLLACSYIFYASWVPRYLLLIALSSTVDFFAGRAMFRSHDKIKRRLWLVFSLVINLGILATFKYFNFFATEFSTLLAQFGLHVTPWHLNVLLPVGISFYTFQSLSYTIDIYRNELTPTDYFFEYLLFVSFFPQLVAGPIVRAAELLPQLRARPTLTDQQGNAAIALIIGGLVKKVVIADTLGAHLVDPVFSNPVMYSATETLVAIYGYAFQIYADFSAYSDIAIGSAALLGLKIPINFNSPYAATDLRDFWRRWHISLSTWLRDYLYIPMGGSKKGPIRTYINLLLTMVIGGLWHGASLNFVFWGTIHGAALAVTRFWQRLHIKPRLHPGLARIVKMVLTFHLVCATWVFFRAANFHLAKQVFANLTSGALGTANIGLWPTFVLAAALALHHLPPDWFNWIQHRFARLPSLAKAALAVGIIALSNQAAQTEVAPFIYFQF